MSEIERVLLHLAYLEIEEGSRCFALYVFNLLDENEILARHEVENAHGRMLQHIRRLQIEHLLELIDKVDGWLRRVVAVDVEYTMARFQCLLEALLEYLNVVFLKLVVEDCALNSIGEDQCIELRHNVDLVVDSVRAQ